MTEGQLTAREYANLMQELVDISQGLQQAHAKRPDMAGLDVAVSLSQLPEEIPAWGIYACIPRRGGILLEIWEPVLEQRSSTSRRLIQDPEIAAQKVERAITSWEH